MRGSAVWLAGLIVALASCSAPPLPPDAPRTSSPPVASSASPTALDTASPGPQSPDSSPTFCAGRTWPPYPLGGVEGITAISTDQATVEIANGTDRTYYYRVAGWEPTQFETCRALAELEVQRGPIAPGATERVTVFPDWRESGVQVTVAFWEERCGEACNREPFTAIPVELSRVEPRATDLPHP